VSTVVEKLDISFDIAAASFDVIGAELAPGDDFFESYRS
jgi:hypothetical protein